MAGLQPGQGLDLQVICQILPTDIVFFLKRVFFSVFVLRKGQSYI